MIYDRSLQALGGRRIRSRHRGVPKAPTVLFTLVPTDQTGPSIPPRGGKLLASGTPTVFYLLHFVAVHLSNRAKGAKRSRWLSSLLELAYRRKYGQPNSLESIFSFIIK